MTKLTTKQKDNLKKVCLVLFEEYSKVKIRNNGRVIFSGRKKSNIPRRSKYNYTFLIDHFLPQRLAMFKYDNIDFLNIIIEDITSCRMRNEDVIEYYYKEIVTIKYPLLFHGVRLPKNMEMEGKEGLNILDFPIINEKTRIRIHIKPIQENPYYFEIVVALTILVTVILLIIFK